MSTSTTSSAPVTPQLVARVARITPVPRAPRPDDPTPRKPPAHLLTLSMAKELGAVKRIRPASPSGNSYGKRKEREEDSVVHRAREVMLNLPRAVSRSSGCSGRADSAIKISRLKIDMETGQSKGSPGFKVPHVPHKAHKKDNKIDVFGAIEHPQTLQDRDGRSRKGKEKAVAVDMESDIEAINKLVSPRYLLKNLLYSFVPDR